MIGNGSGTASTLPRVSEPAVARLLVLYAPSLDLRRLSPETTPALHRLLTDFPPVEVRPQPTNDMFATLLTGTHPEIHGIWEVIRKDEAGGDRLDRLRDQVPDWLSTTVQCARYGIDRSYDLPTVPRRRKRHFELRRLKLRHRLRSAQALDSVGGIPTLLGLLGDDAVFVPSDSFDDISGLLERFPNDKQALQMIEFHALDTLGHWHLDRPEVIMRHLRVIDDFVRVLFDKSCAMGVPMLLLVDHGQGLVTGKINLRRLLRQSGVPKEEYHYFATVCDVRFWFETERARRVIARLLEGTPHLTVLSPEEHEAMNVPKGRRWGEIFAVTREGHILFPHDYHHGLGIRLQALLDSRMRRRILKPHHRGTHGHLPSEPSERGYVLLASSDFAPQTERMELVDFAPTVLSLLGREIPDHMLGQPVFRVRSPHARGLGTGRSEESGEAAPA
jgi:hypothetical protein